MVPKVFEPLKFYCKWNVKIVHIKLSFLFDEIILVLAIAVLHWTEVPVALCLTPRVPVGTGNHTVGAAPRSRLCGRGRHCCCCFAYIQRQ